MSLNFGTKHSPSMQSFSRGLMQDVKRIPEQQEHEEEEYAADDFNSKLDSSMRLRSQ
jgi:hypothetical protein